MKHGIITILLLLSCGSLAEESCLNVREVKSKSIKTTEICLKTRKGFESANGVKIWEPSCEEGTESCDSKQVLFDQAYIQDACLRHSLQQIHIQYQSELSDLGPAGRSKVFVWFKAFLMESSIHPVRPNP
jgi:hypothetical protein